MTIGPGVVGGEVDRIPRRRPGKPDRDAVFATSSTTASEPNTVKRGVVFATPRSAVDRDDTRSRA